MSDEKKIILHRNKQRNSTEKVHSPYVPQYQEKGIEPKEFKSSFIPSDVGIAKPSQDNPRDPKPPMRVPFVELPTVGNMDTWSSIDGEIVDDVFNQDNYQKMIDNNDYITDLALGNPKPKEQKQYLTEDDLKKVIDIEEKVISICLDLKSDEGFVLVDGTIICSGSMEYVQEQVRDLVFGEHELCEGNPIPLDDITVMKKVKVKMGVFLE